MNSLLAYLIIAKDSDKIRKDLSGYLDFLNTPQEDDINESLRLAYRSKLIKTLCECSPDGRLDTVVKLSPDRQIILFDF
jgi:hypothetical protein